MELSSSNQKDGSFAPPKTLPRGIIDLFFVIGLISSICFRIIIVFEKIQPAWVRPVWYIGLIGYLMFFFYRFRVAKKRRTVIRRYKLLEKLEAKTLDSGDLEALKYLVASLSRSREILNYLIIFILSVIAVAVDLGLSLFL